MGIPEEASAHARQTYPAADWPHIAEVVSYAQQLARRLRADEEVVTIAAYFHDISRATMGPEEHNVHSAEMARQWLMEHGYPAQRIEVIASAIVAHMLPAQGPEREAVPLASRILYDADKIGRTQGMALLGALVQLGRKVPWEELSYAQLAAAVRKAREVTQETYESLYTEAARDLARPGYERAIAFCDGILSMPPFDT